MSIHRPISKRSDSPLGRLSFPGHSLKRKVQVAGRKSDHGRVPMKTNKVDSSRKGKEKKPTEPGNKKSLVEGKKTKSVASSGRHSRLKPRVGTEINKNVQVRTRCPKKKMKPSNSTKKNNRCIARGT